jgi:hypothetical protein
MPALPKAIIKPRLLIGEGDDEVFFFEALLEHLNLDDVQAEKYGGKDNLSRYLRELPNRPGYERVVMLGVTRDADTDCADTFDRIRGALASNKFPVPAGCGQIVQGSPGVGVFVMPDNARPGMLEDLCLDAVRDDPAFPCLDQYFQCLAAAGRQPGVIAKAHVHAWLAAQLEPDKRLGEAAKARYWPLDHPALAALRDFLCML